MGELCHFPKNRRPWRSVTLRVEPHRDAWVVVAYYPCGLVKNVGYVPSRSAAYHLADDLTAAYGGAVATVASPLAS